MDSSLVRTFEGVGFSKKEAAVYAALLELGKANASEIAARSQIGRSNVYVTIEKLQKKGYVTTVLGAGVKRFVASDPSAVLSQYQASVQSFKEMMPFIQAMYHRADGKPQIQYFEGKEAVLKAYQDVYRQKGKEVLYITSTQKLYDVMPEEVDFWMRFHKTNKGALPGKHLLSRTDMDEQFAKNVTPYNQDVRFLPEGEIPGMNFFVYGDNVGITSLDGSMFLVLITSEQIAESFRMLFRLLWSASHPS